jgi:putative transposase
VCRYVERNPVRALLVQRAEEWRWSSLYGRDAGGWAASVLAEWPVARPVDWSTVVNTPQTQAEIDAFHRAVRTCEPFGDEAWRKALKVRLGEVAPRKRGRRHVDLASVLYK